MAMTGGIAKLVKTSTTSANTTLDLYVYYKTSQNATNNQSTITLGMYITISSGSIGSWTDGSGSYLGTTSNTFNGSIPNVSGTHWIVENKTMTVDHNSDGTKTATIYWKWGVNSSWGGMVNPSGSFNITLPTIARGTTPTFSVSSVNMGSSVTITFNRASSSFTHKLSYKFGSLTNQTSGLSATTGIATSATFTPPLTLANQIPNTTSGTCTITCETYNGSTLIGTSTATLTLNVPSNIVPSISSVSITEATSGIAAKFHAFVQNKSTLNVAITAAGSYGSTITKYETYIQAVPYREASFTSALIVASGTVGVVTTVTDSRGRTKQVSNSITVLAYSPPVINLMNAYRIDTSGNEDPDGERIAVSMIFSISSVNNLNTRVYRLKYKIPSDSDFTTFASGTASTSYVGTQNFTSSPVISGDNPYTIRLEIQDFFETVSYDFEIPTAFTLIDYRSTGKGMAFGKVSEKNALEVAMDAEFTKKVDIYAPSSDWDNSAFLRLRRSNGTLCAFIATSDFGDGLNIHLYENNVNDTWSGMCKISKTGDVYLSGNLSCSNFKNIQTGRVDITPSAANTPTYAEVTFDTAFSTEPKITVTPISTVPGTQVTGVGISNVSTTGFRIYLTRTNTTSTGVHWIAIA